MVTAVSITFAKISPVQGLMVDSQKFSGTFNDLGHFQVLSRTWSCYC